MKAPGELSANDVLAPSTNPITPATTVPPIAKRRLRPDDDITTATFVPGAHRITRDDTTG